MVAAYEVQAADIAASKAEGLRRHYGFDTDGTRFWDVHTTLELAHADWSTAALSALEADPAVVRTNAAAAAEAWWRFLDEREEAAALAVAERLPLNVYLRVPHSAAASEKARARSR